MLYRSDHLLLDGAMRLRYLVVVMLLFGYVYYVHMAAEIANTELAQIKQMYLELPTQIAQQK
jgi:hypothetical protein